MRAVHSTLINFKEETQSMPNTPTFVLVQRRFQEKILYLPKKHEFIHGHNARLYMWVVIMVKLKVLGYEVLSHMQYSPDLVPSEYFLLKK